MNLLLLLANGFEEIEALGTLDLLRRGNVSVTTCTLNRTPLTLGAHNIAVEAELCLTELDSTQYDGVILPGGMGGSQALAATHGVLELLRDYQQQNKWICAICAAPSILGQKGLLVGKKATCYPGFEDHLTGAVVTGDRVSVDGNVITAKGAGAATEFGLAIVKYLCGQETADKLAHAFIANVD